MRCGCKNLIRMNSSTQLFKLRYWGTAVLTEGNSSGWCKHHVLKRSRGQGLHSADVHRVPTGPGTMVIDIASLWRSSQSGVRKKGKTAPLTIMWPISDRRVVVQPRFYPFLLWGAWTRCFTSVNLRCRISKGLHLEFFGFKHFFFHVLSFWVLQSPSPMRCVGWIIAVTITVQQ